MYQATLIKLKIEKFPVNVASVPQRSPFRFPGGKTWLVPTVRKWLSNFNYKKITLVEPFAGGGIISLTAAFENLAKKIIMVELDEQVAAVWKIIFSKENKKLANKIVNFDLTKENAENIVKNIFNDTIDIAFSTIVKNRIYHGGILANGSGIMKNGENGNGIRSRWYPNTLFRRIRDIESVNHKINFYNDDAYKFIKKYINYKNYCFFIDPPYTVAGKRLYTHYNVDHEKLFFYTSKIKGHYLMTYDNTEEIVNLAKKHKLPFFLIPMKTTHNINKFELIITDSNMQK